MIPSKISASFSKLVLLSVIAGMRSMMAPALLSLNLNRKDKAVLRTSGFDFLADDTAKKVLGVLTTAELIGDKLPFTPSRMKAPLLSGRVLSGAATGALTYEIAGKERNQGAVLGGAVALASSALFYGLRKGLAKSRLIPEPFAGLAEDLLAFYLAGKYLKIINNSGENEPDLVLSSSDASVHTRETAYPVLS